jgi:hypothetical protein
MVRTPCEGVASHPRVVIGHSSAVTTASFTQLNDTSVALTHLRAVGSPTGFVTRWDTPTIPCR